MRVANIYDIDHKTYLLKLARSLSFSVSLISLCFCHSLSLLQVRREDSVINGVRLSITHDRI